jgi:hypothetical protein
MPPASTLTSMASGTPAGDGLTGADVVFTPGRGYRAPVVRRGAVSLTVAGLLALLAGFGVLTVVTGPLAAAFALAALAQAVLYLGQGRFRTRLTATGIEARGYRTRMIPWSDVTGLDVAGHELAHAKQLGVAGQPWNSPVRDPGFWLAPEGGYRARLATIRVIRRHGRPVLLRAPVVTARQDDPEFADKARLIGQYWRDYGQGGVVPG